MSERLIELLEGFWCDPFEAKIVKQIDHKSCLLYFTGEGAMDGHVVPYPAEEVVDIINEARRKIEEGDEEEVEEPEEEEEQDTE